MKSIDLLPPLFVDKKGKRVKGDLIKGERVRVLLRDARRVHEAMKKQRRAWLYSDLKLSLMVRELEDNGIFYNPRSDFEIKQSRKKLRK